MKGIEQTTLWMGKAERAATTVPAVSARVAMDRANSRIDGSIWKTVVSPIKCRYLSVDVVETVDEGGPSDETLEEDDQSHDQEVRDEGIDTVKEEEDGIYQLKRSKDMS